MQKSKTQSDRTLTIPEEVIEMGRTVDGRFAPGHPGVGGRPSGIDLRALAERKSEEEGYDFPTAMWEVIKALIENAKAGNVSAAKLLLDKFCTGTAHDVVLNIDRT